MISSTLRIPLERIAVLIGQEGKTKQQIENETQVQIEVDSEEGSIEISATEEIDDPTIVWAVRDCVKAIGRGFSPRRALALLDPDIFLEIIPLEGPPKWIQRMRGRLIGERGKTRRIIEQNTDAMVSVYGQTISIIGSIEEIKAAKEAVEMLIRGDRHGTVYRYLQNLRFQQKLQPQKIWRDGPSDYIPKD